MYKKKEAALKFRAVSFLLPSKLTPGLFLMFKKQPLSRYGMQVSSHTNNAAFSLLFIKKA